MPRGLPTPGLPSVAAGDLLGAARRRRGPGAGGSRRGAERCPAVRRPRRLPRSTPTRSCSPPAWPTSAPACSVASGWPAACPRRRPCCDARGRTQMAGIAAAVLSLVVIVAIAPVALGAARAVLSAIVVNAVWKLMDFAALRRYARVRRNDIVAAVGRRRGRAGLRPAVRPAARGGRVGAGPGLPVEPGRRRGDGQGAAREGRVGQHPRTTRSGRRSPGSWCSASTRRSSGSPRRRSTTSSSPRSRLRPALRALVLDMEATNQMDTTSADVLADLLGELRKRDIDLYLVRVMWPVRRVLRRSGLMDELGEDHLWHSISQGVREARRAHGLKHLPATAGAARRSRRGAARRGHGGGRAHRCTQSGSRPPDRHRRRSGRLKAHRASVASYALFKRLRRL